MNMDDALHTFIVEGRELLEQMEDALLQVEQAPGDLELIGAIFRAAHTIKGSAGLFGLDHVVRFTHVAESVLDRVRSAEVAIDSSLVALLLAVGDQIGCLLDGVAAGQAPDAAAEQGCSTLADRLRQYLPEVNNALVEPLATVAPEEGDNDMGHWHISLRFNRDVLRHGLEPLAFIRYLTTFGRIARIVTLVDSVPTLSDLEPDASYLGYEIKFHSGADKALIESAFEFVRDDARIRILPPSSKIADYVRFIHELPAEELLLGEILVSCGTLTRTELDEALAAQAGQDESASPTPPPIGELLIQGRLVQPQVVAAALDKQQQVKEHKAAESGLIRVNAEKLDQHINLIGELIIASAGISAGAQRQRSPELLEAASLLARLVEEIRDSALQLRMVPIGATFNKFQRVVRDVSQELGKDIRLEINGADTELDKTVVEKIGDPLTHLVRNSMDHGIEAAELRLSRGKPAHGTVRFNAFHDSGSIVIEVADDGGGLDRARILAKAIERGLVNAEQALSDSEIDQLIFEPGLTTAEKLNNLSGRGVGMDVVRRNITALRGSIEIDNRPGLGTKIQVRLPLTLAIIDGFLVGVEASTFVIPLDLVVECVELTPQESADSQGRDHLNLRGEVLPFIRLKQLFEIREPVAEAMDSDTDSDLENDRDFAENGASALLTAEGAAALANDPELTYLLHPVRRENIVVVQYSGRRAGLVVDKLMGEFQTVIRPLGAVFSGIDGISGFTILGSGNVALILDVPGLVRRVGGKSRAPTALRNLERSSAG